MKQLLRRDLQLFKRGIIPALILVVLFSGISAAIGISAYRDIASGQAPVRVALVDADDSLQSRLCINLVENQGFMTELLSFVSAADEQEASAMLENGQCAAAILLPEHFVENIMTGQTCRGRILLSRSAASSAELVRAVVQFGELLLAAGQQGVFSGETLLLSNFPDSALHTTYLEKVNLDLINFALEVNDTAFVTETLPYAGTGVSLKGHYATGWIALFLVICGLFFSELYTADSRRPLLNRLFASGITPGQFLLGKFIFPFLFRALILCLLLPLLNRFVPLDISCRSMLGLLLCVALSTVFLSCTAISMTHGKNWQGLILAVCAAGLFLTGGIVPRSMLPKYLTCIGDYSPFGVLKCFLLPLFGGILPIGPAIIALCYAAGLPAFCLFRLRMPYEKGGTS